MDHDPIIFAVFLMFAGAAVLATAALFARQSLLVAYIALGVLAGPWVTGLVAEPDVVQKIGHIGIIFLLFLLGLNLHPQKLLHMLGEATRVTLLSSLVFVAAGFAAALGFGFDTLEALIIGAAMMFSSTIIGLKLLPTTELHQRHMGEVIISVLLLQDIIAIAILLLLQGSGGGDLPWQELLKLALALPALVAVAFLVERAVLMPLIQRFDTIREYVFLVAIGWCLGVAELGRALGVSYEIGAFTAGVTLAYSPIATFIAESLKPLRDFFLIMFFFSLGVGFDLGVVPDILVPAVVLAALALALKPPVYRWLLVRAGEAPRLSAEIGTRLGQVSEFSLLIAVVALESGVIGERASYLIQTITLFTFIVSSYLVVLRFPTPIAVNERLRRD